MLIPLVQHSTDHPTPWDVFHPVSLALHILSLAVPFYVVAALRKLLRGCSSGERVMQNLSNRSEFKVRNYT
jgi:hypothetical protein